MINITDKPEKVIEVRKGTIILYIGHGCEKTEWTFDLHTSKNGTVSYEVFVPQEQISQELPQLESNEVRAICNIICGTVEACIEKQKIEFK